jgi:hypothetical protein
MAKFVTPLFRRRLLKFVAALKQMNFIDETVKRIKILFTNKFTLLLNI